MLARAGAGKRVVFVFGICPEYAHRFDGRQYAACCGAFAISDLACARRETGRAPVTGVRGEHKDNGAQDEAGTRIMRGCRVALVDDHAVFRETLGLILTQSGLEVAAEAGTTSQCLQLMAANDIDVLVLDLSLPGRGGGDLVSQITQRYPQVGILILSARPPDHFIARLIQEGAAGYLHKSCSLQDVVAAVKQISRGERVLGEAAQLYEVQDGQPHESLSNREYQVMERLVNGASITAIAEEMHLSVKTISTYRKRLLEKLGVENNSDLVAYAIERKLKDV